MKFRLPPRRLDQAMFPRGLAEALDSAKPEPKPITRHERVHRIQVRLIWQHAEGLHWYSVAACPVCQDNAARFTYALSAVWFPRDVHRMFKL